MWMQFALIALVNAFAHNWIDPSISIVFLGIQIWNKSEQHKTTGKFHHHLWIKKKHFFQFYGVAHGDRKICWKWIWSHWINCKKSSSAHALNSWMHVFHTQYSDSSHLLLKLHLFCLVFVQHTNSISSISTVLPIYFSLAIWKCFTATCLRNVIW